MRLSACLLAGAVLFTAAPATAGAPPDTADVIGSLVNVGTGPTGCSVYYHRIVSVTVYDPRNPTIPLVIVSVPAPYGVYCPR